MPKFRWEVYEDGRYLGEYDLEEVCKMTGMRKNNVATYADLGTPYKGKYRIDRVKKKTDSEKEWDKTVHCLKNG